MPHESGAFFLIGFSAFNPDLLILCAVRDFYI